MAEGVGGGQGGGGGGYLMAILSFPNLQLCDNSPLTRSFPSSPTHDTDDGESSLSLELAEL